MIIKYDIDIITDSVVKNIERITNLIFKLLPLREEGGEWEPLLKNIIIELGGMGELLKDHVDLFSLLCRLEALLTLTNDEDFLTFRKTIFECLRLSNYLKKAVNHEKFG